MTLVTCDSNKPWACTVYYGVGEQMTLYVVTDPRSRHGQQIRKNSLVAFTIFDSNQKITGPKQGVQGTGTIQIITGRPEAITGLSLWHKANRGLENRITVDNVMKKSSDTRVYKISPTFLKYFNKQLYGSKEYAEIEI